MPRGRPKGSKNKKEYIYKSRFGKIDKLHWDDIQEWLERVRQREQEEIKRVLDDWPVHEIGVCELYFQTNVVVERVRLQHIAKEIEATFENDANDTGYTGRLFGNKRRRCCKEREQE